jgi:hypothetical protein
VAPPDLRAVTAPGGQRLWIGSSDLIDADGKLLALPDEKSQSTSAHMAVDDCPVSALGDI